MSMIRSSTSRSQTGQPQVQCPVSGCSKMLTKGDLQTDHALVRKIKRIQDAKRLEEDDEEDDDGPAGTQRGATFIDDDDEDGADVDDVVAGRVPATQVKGEPRASERPRASQPGGTGVVDLGNSSDEAEEEEEEDEEFSTTIGY